jgi:hypothetical protein
VLDVGGAGVWPCHHFFCGTAAAGFAAFSRSRCISRQVASSE